jgi:hypothetical protein
MAQQLALGWGGMVLLALAVCRFKRRALQNTGGVALAIALGLWGVGLITIAAGEAVSRWIARLGVIGISSAAGGNLGATAAALVAKKRAGALLASVGTSVPIRFKSGPGMLLAAGMIGVVLQFMDLVAEGYRPAATLSLMSQFLFFLALAGWMTLMAETPWSLAEHGILGPNVFVPWPQVVDYHWQDSNTLAITSTGRQRLIIPVVPHRREHAAAILPSKLAER